MLRPLLDPVPDLQRLLLTFSTNLPPHPGSCEPIVARIVQHSRTSFYRCAFVMSIAHLLSVTPRLGRQNVRPHMLQTNHGAGVLIQRPGPRIHSTRRRRIRGAARDDSLSPRRWQCGRPYILDLGLLASNTTRPRFPSRSSLFLYYPFYSQRHKQPIVFTRPRIYTTQDPCSYSRLT